MSLFCVWGLKRSIESIIYHKQYHTLCTHTHRKRNAQNNCIENSRKYVWLPNRKNDVTCRCRLLECVHVLMIVALPVLSADVLMRSDVLIRYVLLMLMRWYGSAESSSFLFLCVFNISSRKLSKLSKYVNATRDWFINQVWVVSTFRIVNLRGMMFIFFDAINFISDDKNKICVRKPIKELLRNWPAVWVW